VKKLFGFALLAVAAWFYLHEPAAAWRGMPAAHDPVQLASGLPAPFVHAGYTFTPLARYTVTAVVLGRERYRNDREADLAPLDLVLGWGPMSLSAVINDLRISQSGRWYEYRWSGEPPLDPGLMATHSANTHCLPADDVRAALLAVKRHDVVTLEGYLVEVTGADGYHWRSSLSRDDTGGHSCEVLWVTKVDHRRL
jgi:hypothetical protein